MSPLTPTRQRYVIIAALGLLMLLACGPVDRLRQLNRQRQAVATGAAIIDKNNNLTRRAYQKIQTLPGYRLESQAIERDSSGHRRSRVVIKTVDARGNVHTLTESSGDRQDELYFVNGHTYIFHPQHKGWVDAGAITSTETIQAGQVGLASLEPAAKAAQLLTQLAAVPVETGREMLNNRAATRYELQYIATEITGAFDRQPGRPPATIRGTLWIDNATGALLKSEILLYEDRAARPAQEYILEIGQIGVVAPITVPSPLVEPLAIAATATAQARTVIEARLEYGDERLNFELIPIRVSQLPDSSPLSAGMHLRLRRLPEHLFQPAQQEKFLIQLRQKLSLSIPQRNLIITSSGFGLESSDAQERSLEVIYFFNADLENFGHVELILSQPGNPFFAPVSVE